MLTTRAVLLARLERLLFIFFFSSRRRHTRCSRDWSSDVCSSDLDDRGIFLPAGDALHGKCKLRCAGDRAELCSRRHRRGAIPARKNKQATLAGRAGGVPWCDARLAQPEVSNFPYRRRWYLGLRLIDLRGVSDLDGRAKALIVRIVDRNAYVHCFARFEMQDVVRSRVRRKPVVPFDIFAVVLETRKSLVFLLL